ncbi:MAG: RHS repeat-associated core domain-containing protein [Ignavibacteria bacterium]|nr:RHS repeat-associated core domain-containing protein [Ignavibacteria bacterium]
MYTLAEKLEISEKDAETGLHYFGARYYDSELGRWMSIDPKADQYSGWSPYNYCTNNTLGNIDPDGEGIMDFVKGFVSAMAGNANPLSKTTTVESYNGNQTHYAAGRVVGDCVSVLTGLTESAAGATEAGGGVVVTATGAGAAVGVPAIAMGSALVVHGGLTVTTAATNLGADLSSMQSNSNGNSNSKNEKHGDGGRAKTKAEKQIDQYKEQLKDATGREAKKIEQKIKNVRQNAEKKAKGEEHSRGEKR